MDDKENDYYFISFDNYKIEGLIELHCSSLNIDSIENWEDYEMIFFHVCRLDNYCIVARSSLFSVMILYFIHKKFG